MTLRRTNDSLVYWLIYASFDHDDLTISHEI